ncbi:MAG: efflux RND transporter periplasmic adaptor subunit [Holophagae bacterium]|jgi:RND family efflux transporter MFP subunit
MTCALRSIDHRFGRRWTASVLTLFTLGSVSACRGTPETAAPPPPEVIVATPVQRDVTVFSEFTGTTEARRSVEVRARVQGLLESIEFEPSSFVRAGDVLFIIEPAPYRAQRDRAEAGLESAEAGLARAESDLDRLEQAVKTNAVSQQEVTRARAERDQASAAVLQAQTTLTNAEIELGYTTVASPIDGMISRNFVDVGNLVGAGEPTLLATVRQIDPIYAYFDVSERLIASLLATSGGHKGPASEGQIPITLVLKETGYEVEGTVDAIDNTVDPATGTMQVRGIFPNSDALVLPGFFVHVRLPGKLLAGALLVEETALGTDLGGRYLMIVGDGNVVEKRYVEPGPLEEDMMRVVLDGVEPGERYVSKGLQRARPGMPVTPKTADAGS